MALIWPSRKETSAISADANSPPSSMKDRTRTMFRVVSFIVVRSFHAQRAHLNSRTGARELTDRRT